MSKVYHYECTYCGTTWTELEDYDIKCKKCGDENLKVKKIEKVDYYS